MNEIRQQAAVLVPVFCNESGELCLVLLRRTEGDIHGGQLAFPGGKKSKRDKSLEETALRETEEETGLKRSDITIIEQLPNVYTQTSQFDVTPFLAKIVRPGKWIPSEREVAEIIEVKLSDLARPDAYSEEVMNFKHWPAPRNIPFYWVGQYKLWGATYRILSPILLGLLNGNWKI